MTLYPNLVTVGTINSGATPIQADVSAGLGSALPVKVLLSQNYSMLNPPGYPNRPMFVGAAAVTWPASISAGTTVSVHAPEAAALVGAGAGTYV